MGDYEAGIDAAENAHMPGVRCVVDSVEAALAEWGRCPGWDHDGVTPEQCACAAHDGTGRVPFAVVPDGDGWRIVPLTAMNEVRNSFTQWGSDEAKGRSRLVGPWEPS